MEGEKNIFENEKLLDTLFDYSNKEDDVLYKNDIYSPLMEEQNIREKDSKSKIELTRDKILQKLSLEEYSTCPTNNDSIILNTKEKGKEKVDQEKLSEEEIDYLQNLHKINYLTFSPFGTSFYPNLINNKKENVNESQENKILDILDFDYNNFEINNDLLFNINMGFIDINKLEIDKVVINDNNSQSQSKNKNAKKNSLHNLTEEKINNNNIIPEHKESENEEEKTESEILNTSLLKELNDFIESNKDIFYYKTIFEEFDKEINDEEKAKDISKKNESLEKWKKIFDEKKEAYKRYLIKEEKRKKMEEKKKKE